MSGLAEPRIDARALEAYGELYVIGGYNGSHTLDTMEMYNYETDQWRRANHNMNVNRSNHCVVRYRDGIYVMGGKAIEPNSDETVVNSFELYNLTTQIWSPMPSMRIARSGLACVISEQGVLAAGGIDKNGTILQDVDLFNQTTGEWEQKAGMTVARMNFGLTMVNGKVAAIGGSNSQGSLKSAEEMDKDFNFWTPISSLELEVARSQFAMANVPIELIAEGCTEK